MAEHRRNLGQALKSFIVRFAHMVWNVTSCFGEDKTVKDSGFDDKEVQVHLTPSIWQNLPDYLLARVLTKLPISSLNNCRRVCKWWKAFIESDDFTHRCHSVEWTAFYYDDYLRTLHIARISPQTDSWEERHLDFVSGEQGVGKLLAADQGLLCLLCSGRHGRIRNEIAVILCNPLTRKWRRLIIPHRLQTETGGSLAMDGGKIFGGLIVDDDTGHYKLVVASVGSELTRKTFIYDSLSDSWTIAALSPKIDQRFESARWEIQRSISCSGDLYWLVEQMDSERKFHFKTLIKFNIGVDSWGSATQEVPCDHIHYCYPHLVSMKNRLFMVNFTLAACCQGLVQHNLLFPERFSELVPNLQHLHACQGLLLQNHAPCGRDYQHNNPTRVAAVAGTWLIESQYARDAHMRCSRVFFSDERVPRSIHLPDIRLRICSNSLFIFASRFRAFV